jgi:hypothetical protein
MFTTSPSRQLEIARELREADIAAATSARRRQGTPAAAPQAHPHRSAKRPGRASPLGWIARRLGRPTAA